MRFGRTQSKFDLDRDVILRSYIAQGIKLLYFDRKHFFSEENRDFAKLNEILKHISDEIKQIVSEKPRMLIPSKNGFSYEVLTQKTANKISNFLTFITELPPPGSRIISKWKKSSDIGMMRVPTLTYILYSTTEYKIPGYYARKIDDYACISAAIIDIFRESSTSIRVNEISEEISRGIKDKINIELKNEYKENIVEWVRLGLLI